MKYAKNQIPDKKCEKILEKLGIKSKPDNTLTGINEIYQAVRIKIPYDNLRKRVIIATCPEKIPPLISAERFFNDWLNEGIGGTCWEWQEALYCLLSDLHFSVRLALSSVHEGNYQRTPYNHGSLVVDVDDESLLFDPSLLLGLPLPLRPHAVVQPAFRSELRCSGRAWCLVWHPLCRPGVECHLLRLNASVSEVQRHRLLATGSGEHPFNAASHIRLMRENTIIGLVKGERVIRHADGQESRQALSRSQQLQLLIDEFGVSERLAVQVPPDRPLEPRDAPQLAAGCPSAG